jgi:nucleotide-binding universal stress UspA family protein
MKYNTLLTLHYSHEPITSLKPAIALANSMQAHLEIRVLSLITSVSSMAMNTDHIYAWGESLGELVGETQKRVTAVKAWLDDQEVDAVVTSSYQPLGQVDENVSGAALYADLVLCNRSGESIVVGDLAKTLDSVIFDAGKPVLILTENTGSIDCDFKSISIAWDPVPQAMKALTASIPLLKNASDVELLIVTQNEDKEAYSTETKKIVGWLRRHDIKATLKLIPQGGKSVSVALIEHINNANRDLVIMGAYGHSRFSERFFSGVSYEVLDQSNTPLLVAH